MSSQNKTHREHRELGDVAWYRDFNEALGLSASNNKPILLLFQEIPGCSTCVNYGQDVLSHPLMAEVIKEHFIPLAIYNNHEGHDAKILMQFGEAPWNNPVVYFLDAAANPIISKLDNRFQPLALHEKIVEVMAKLGIIEPPYFSLFRDDLIVDTGIAKTAIFETPCFWSGETSLAQHEAVLITEAGWIDGDEVVRVKFDPNRVSDEALEEYARDQHFSRTHASKFSVDMEPQYYLRKTKFRYLPLTSAQATRINVAHPYGENAAKYLSPTQQRWLDTQDLEKVSDPELYRKNFRMAWNRLQAALPCL